MRQPFSLLAVLIVAAGSARAGEVDPLLPKDTDQVFQINVKQVVDSDVFKKNFLGRIQKEMQKEEVKRQFELFGVDPLKDVEKVTVGLSGKGPTDTKMVAVLRGKFDAERLFEGVQEHVTRTPDRVSLEDVEDGDEKWKLVKVAFDKDRPMYVSVANASTLVVGMDAKQVASALTAAKNKERPKLGKELTALVLKQDDKASLYYCSVMEGRMELDKIPANAFDPLKAFGIDPDVLKKQLGTLSTIAYTVRLGKEVGVSVTAGMKDEDSAEEFGGQSSTLSKLIDTGKTFLPLAAGQQPKMKALIDDLVKTTATKVKGKDVTVTLTVTAAAVEAAFKEDE